MLLGSAPVKAVCKPVGEIDFGSEITYVATRVITDESARDFEDGADAAVVTLLADRLLVDDGTPVSSFFYLCLFRLILGRILHPDLSFPL